MTSETQAAGRLDFMARLAEQKRQREEWEAANPELAAAWTEAWREDERWHQEQERQAQLTEAERKAPGRLAHIGIPLRCAELVRTASETPSLTAARAFRNGEETFLLLLGGAGAGKSVAASWALADLLWPMLSTGYHVDGHNLRRKAVFIRACELARVTASDYDEAARELLEECMRVPWLVIDDLGAERAWDGWMARLDELVDARYGDKRRTIITSNLDGKAFKERYGQRITDRIRDDGRIVSAGAKSLRKEQGAA